MASGNVGRQDLRKLASSSLEAIKRGSYTFGDTSYDLEQKVIFSKQHTRYYAPDSSLSQWSASNIPSQQSNATPNSVSPCSIQILEISTLDGARLLASQTQSKIGILNFASAKKAGGGFITGAQAQEESIARSSTLYPTLQTSVAQQFYTLHNRDSKQGYYSHAMIYSPKVVVFRDDHGGWTQPMEVDVLTSPAVNAGVIRKSLLGRVAGKATEDRIESTMRERMARILFLFEREGVRNLVLGSFGTGVFQNSVEVVARLWSELLGIEGARFKSSFDCVVFAVLGRKTYDNFKDSFMKQMTSTGDS